MEPEKGLDVIRTQDWGQLPQNIRAALLKGNLVSLSEKEREWCFLLLCSTYGLSPITGEACLLSSKDGKGNVVHVAFYVKSAGCDKLAIRERLSWYPVPTPTGAPVTIIYRGESPLYVIATVEAWHPGSPTEHARRVQQVGVCEVRGGLEKSIMHAITRAKRRAILSICGINALTEEDKGTIEGASSEG